MKMKIFIYKTMFEFVPSVKTSNGEYLESMVIVDTKSSIVNNTSGFLTPALAISNQSQ